MNRVKSIGRQIGSRLIRHLGLEPLDKSVLDSINDSNFDKLYLETFLGFLITFLFFVIFHFFSEIDTPTKESWRIGIEFTHFTLTSILLILSVLSFLQTKTRTGQRTAYEIILQVMTIAVAFVGGIALTVIDQNVTASISPFLVVCIIVALLFKLRPIVAFCIFFLAYGVFFFSIGIYQHNPAIILSNRVNALAMAIIGGFLSSLFWRTAVKSKNQQDYIEKQQLELEKINKQLTILASSDGLTGLQNRRMLDHRLKEELKNARVSHTPLSMILFDLDHFKEYNDLYGHVQGDDCLKLMSSRLLESLDLDKDSLFRYGGEEFFLLLPNCPAEKALETAERIRQGIIALQIIHEGNPSVSFVSASFGVFTLENPQVITDLEVLQQVDTLLYRAKAQGRNCSVYGVA